MWIPGSDARSIMSVRIPSVGMFCLNVSTACHYWSINLAGSCSVFSCSVLETDAGCCKCTRSWFLNSCRFEFSFEPSEILGGRVILLFVCNQSLSSLMVSRFWNVVFSLILNWIWHICGKGSPPTTPPLSLCAHPLSLSAPGRIKNNLL